MLLLKIFLTLVVSVLFVEFLGYWVHRAIFHFGLFGSGLRKPHVQHHLEDYPPEDLRPQKRGEYKSAADPLWHVIGGCILLTISLLVIFGVVPVLYGVLLAVFSTLYAKYVVSVMHKQFHLPGSPLRKYAWFTRLVQYHDVHHYVNANYGIVFMWMDRLFGTFVPNSGNKRENIFPGFRKGRA